MLTGGMTMNWRIEHARKPEVIQYMNAMYRLNRSMFSPDKWTRAAQSNFARHLERVA